jgi:hypothetical protein
MHQWNSTIRERQAASGKSSIILRAGTGGMFVRFDSQLSGASSKFLSLIE